jgi:predicted DsbA family dithiol-disulfide isomerase
MQKLKAILSVSAIIFVVALIIFNASRPIATDFHIWNTALTKGNPEAGKHFIMFTDIFCPYCDKFSNALITNKADFEENYINNDKILFEIRVTHLNYLSGHSDNSKPAGVAAYCAARQDRFWPYYETLLSRLFDDYHSKGIGVDKTSPKIPTLDLEYFIEPASDAQLDIDPFKTCLENNETLEELENATKKAQQQIESGVPYFVFGNFRQSGFNGTWDTTNDYTQAKLLLDAGLTQ